MKTVSVFEEIEENYPQPSKYAKAQVNALDEVSQSYSHQENPKLDQTRHTIETQDHESMDSKMIRLLLSVVDFIMKKDMQSWIVLLCFFTSEQVLLGMWNYRMW
jgi:hypothetical protein